MYLSSVKIFQNYPNQYLKKYSQMGSQDQLDYMYYDYQLDKSQFEICDLDGS